MVSPGFEMAKSLHKKRSEVCCFLCRGNFKNSNIQIMEGRRKSLEIDAQWATRSDSNRYGDVLSTAPISTCCESPKHYNLNNDDLYRNDL